MVSLFFLCGEVVFNSDYGYFLDLPEGWSVLEITSEGKVVFSGPSESVFLQVKAETGDVYSSAYSMYEVITEKLNGTGDCVQYLFSGYDTCFADITFQAGEFPFRGYFLFINGTEYDFTVFSFTTEDLYESMHDFLLSSLDSFAINETGMKKPGGVSQFFYPFPSPDKKNIEIPFLDSNLNLKFDSNELDTTAVLIEREARVFASYVETDMAYEAWERYYRVIYRDNYHRVDGIFRSLSDYFAASGYDPDNISRKLLEWVQGFEYTRTGTLSDFSSPINTAVNRSGDCDSRSLLYIILLEHFNINSILMLSTAYSHALAAVDIDGIGARFSYNGLNYLIAETTDSVDIGLIDITMADPSGWMGIDFSLKY